MRNRQPVTSVGAFGLEARDAMATKAKKQTARGRKQDRARVAGGQDYEVNYESKKTRRSKSAVKKAVKKVGNTHNRLEKRLRAGSIGGTSRKHLRTFLRELHIGAASVLAKEAALYGEF
jgi:hypothetical protein